MLIVCLFLFVFQSMSLYKMLSSLTPMTRVLGFITAGCWAEVCVPVRPLMTFSLHQLVAYSTTEILCLLNS